MGLCRGRGEAYNACNLVNEEVPIDVEKIRRMAMEGHRQVDLAQQFGISFGVISKIVLGQLWIRH